jgi:hypothetical protein
MGEVDMVARMQACMLIDAVLLVCTAWLQNFWLFDQH